MARRALGFVLSALGWPRAESRGLRAARAILIVLSIVVASRALAQERGAIALGEAVQGLGVNTRVLLIAAHPDDEDTFLIAWLSRGRHVETAYLSLTRGDGGQNLIGNELGEALGVIRTEELLAARRVDGARQYFTRAFDFGFSKDTIDTYKHWQRDSILGDVVRVIRMFRPHVIVAVFSGTPRDGHGHHQVSGLLAREAYRVAADTLRFPTAAFGAPWTPLKLYGNARYDPTGGVTLQFDVGEYSPLLGRSYAEIAGESRSQHKSQGFGALQRKGPLVDALRREMSRVNEQSAATAERSLFDGMDTTWARFRGSVADPRGRAALDSLPAAFAAVRAAFDAFAPERLLVPLASADRLLKAIDSHDRDFELSSWTAKTRVRMALAQAAGTAAEVSASREVVALGDSIQIASALYNRGTDTIGGVVRSGPGTSTSGPTLVGPPKAVLQEYTWSAITKITQPWWLARPRTGDMFASGTQNPNGEGAPDPNDLVYYSVQVPRVGATFSLGELPVFRFADQVRGEIRRVVAGAPAISVTLEQQTQYAPANTEFLRNLTVHLRSADTKRRDARVSLSLPRGLSADSLVRSVQLEGYDATQAVTFRLRGRLPVGMHSIGVTATSGGETFTTGYDLMDYDHIRRQRIYRPATTRLSAVDMRVPSTLRVAYITGVGDNVVPTLAQLGIPVTVIPANEVARADLQPYTTIVIGPRAYEAHPALVAANARLFEFARKGGTLVVQYGQYEMTQPGVMPYPITLARPADRVTEEDSPVTIDAPDEKVLRSPNRIGASDFAGWVQERTLYMPRTFDEHYRAPLAMHDTGETPNKGAILVAPLGEGLYIYTTLSLFRQLPAGVPGGARLFLNLLSAGLVSPSISP
jgi:LmbE family N-acetylglucosaminyl deacetylase